MNMTLMSICVAGVCGEHEQTTVINRADFEAWSENNVAHHKRAVTQDSSGGVGNRD